MVSIKTILAITTAYFLSQTPPKIISGSVVAVHQGDTFTIQSASPNEKLYKKHGKENVIAIQDTGKICYLEDHQDKKGFEIKY